MRYSLEQCKIFTISRAASTLNVKYIFRAFLAFLPEKLWDTNESQDANLHICFSIVWNLGLLCNIPVSVILISTAKSVSLSPHRKHMTSSEKKTF